MGVKYSRWSERSLSRYEESRGWLGTSLRPSPENAPAFDSDPEANYRYVARSMDSCGDEELCACGAGEHRPCECWRKGKRDVAA